MATSNNGPIHDGVNPPSLVSRVVAWDWHDGPIEGILQVNDRGEVFQFRMLEEKPASGDEDDIRVYGLYPLPLDSLDRLIAALTPYHEPRQPIWWPVWQFPSDEIKAQMDELVDKIKESAGALVWIIATNCSFASIRAMSITESASAA